MNNFVMEPGKAIAVAYANARRFAEVCLGTEHFVLIAKDSTAYQLLPQLQEELVMAGFNTSFPAGSNYVEILSARSNMNF